MRRVLVTGGAGFIGQPVVAALLTRGYAVHVTVRSESQASLLPGAVTVHVCDLMDCSRSGELMQGVRPEILVHLAWVTEPGDYWGSLANLDWLTSSVNLFRHFLDAGGSHCLVAGTSAEYDWGGGGPLIESQAVLKPQFLYGSCKLALFHAASALFAQKSVPLAWVRLFCPFGPRENPMRLIPKTVLRLLRQEFVVVDAGGEIRDFLHVEDIANAIASLVQRQVDGAVNVASGQPTSIRAVIEEVAGYLEAQDRVVFQATRQSVESPLSVVAAIDHLKKVADWNPPPAFRERIAQTCDYWRRRMREEAGLQKLATTA